jgi:Xaa-Pro aminopeptidase
MNKETIRKRIKAIRRELNKKRISCLIVTKPANVTYTTGFLGEDSWTMITKNQVYLLTDSRYTEQAQKECPSCKIIERTGAMAEAIAQLIKKLKSIRTVTVEKSTSIASFEELKKHVKARFKTEAGVIETIRSVKDSDEIAAIKTAASISAKALKNIRRYMKPGITESELAGMLDFQFRKLGATNGFPTIVAFGPNASRPHHQPGARKLKKKDTILIDFGARYKGYCCDITRCFVCSDCGEGILPLSPAVGKMPAGRKEWRGHPGLVLDAKAGRPRHTDSPRVNAFFEKVYTVVEQAQAAAIKMIKAGVKLKQLDAAAREVIAKSDLPVYGHGSGHGFGLEIHEEPFLKPDGKGILKAGQVLTIEPGIYIPGKIGVRIEDDCLVTKTGCKILTKMCPH